MSPRKKATPEVVKEPKKVEKKVDNVEKAKITIEDVVEFFKKNPEHLVKETYYGRYSFFLDNDFNIKK